MFKKLIVSGFFLLIICSGYLNYKVLKSFIEQTYLIYEFNAYQTKIPLEDIKSFNFEIPNITVTTLPLKMLKARYLMRDSIVDEALDLLYASKKANPFLKVSEAQLANYHINKKNMDSALYYSKRAFEALPRNYQFSKLYFKILAKLKMDTELDYSFNKIKGNFIIDQWQDYLFSKIEIGETPKDELVKVLEELEGNVSNPEQFTTLETILKVGLENLDDLGKMIVKAETFYSQDNFTEAAVIYEKASRLNPSDYTHYENAALSYYRADKFEQAERLFRYTLRTFNPQNGKAELYLGLLLYEKKEIKEACKFWNISNGKGYAGTRGIIDTFCK